MQSAPRAIEWVGNARDGHLRLLDQTQLCDRVVYLDCRDVASVRDAIRRLSVRGAPAIGIAAAYGCVIGGRAGRLEEAVEALRTSRPTAVNLFWALDRMRAIGTEEPEALLEEARAIHAEDAAMCEAIGRHGRPLVEGLAGAVLTHCNAGALATGGLGTVTAPLYLAHDAGTRFAVLADETRPLLQGARLTAWELAAAGIDVTVLCDDMAASAMQQGKVGMVLTGADRIAANGDVANKIGTYGLAVLAKHHGIPFYVAAPSSTFDFSVERGDDIPIEQRNPDEVRTLFDRRIVPDAARVHNPAFDVTPHTLVSGLITERGLIRPVDRQTIREVLEAEPV